MSPNGSKIGSRVKVAKINDALLDSSLPPERSAVCKPLKENRRLGAYGRIVEWKVQQNAPVINGTVLVVQHEPRSPRENVRGIYSYEELEPVE